MTPKIRVDLSEAGCQKPGCKRKYSGPAHRHHKRHKKHWINRIERDDWGSLRVDRDVLHDFAKRLRERYYRWLSRDLVRLCDFHHVEIHELYRRIIRFELQQLWWNNKRVGVREVVRIMRLCRLECEQWLGKKTRGISPRRAGWRASETVDNSPEIGYISEND